MWVFSISCWNFNLFLGNFAIQSIKKTMYSKKTQEKICPYCGQSSQTVFVHGHEQCVVCKTNVEPCCQGEVMSNDRNT